MKRALLFSTCAFILIASLITVSFALYPVQLLVNGYDITSDAAPQLVGGKVVASVRSIANALHADISWNSSTRTVQINSKDMMLADLRIQGLERALAPKDPQSAVTSFAEGVKTRNGALQFAMLSPELREAQKKDFDGFNWCTGVSSPWVSEYKIGDEQEGEDDTRTYAVTFTYTDSAPESFVVTENITVKKNEEHWFVSAISDVGKDGQPVQ